MKKLFIITAVSVFSLIFNPGCSPSADKAVKSEKASAKNNRLLGIANRLLKDEADLNQPFNARFKPSAKGHALLVWAVAKENSETVKFLLDNGADPNVKLMAGSTESAIFESTPAVNIEISMENIKFKRGQTKEICKLLINGGADVNYKNQLGQTVLHKAAVNARDDICALLLENGADINTQDKMGNTALHKAAMYGSYKVVELLIKKGAEIDLKNAVKKTALDLAEQRLDENLHKKIKKDMPTAYPYSDYDKTIKRLKNAG